MTDTTSPPPEEIAKGLPFDESIIQTLREAVNACLTEHPELRSVGIALDFNGRLNDSQEIRKGMWLGSDGAVIRPAAVFGSMEATQGLLDMQFSRAAEMMSNLKEEAHVVLTETKNRKEKLERLRSEQREAGDNQSAADPAGDSTE